MQQQEQLILQKLAEAREAQASAMTRFFHARAHLAQLEARHQALRASVDATGARSIDMSELSRDLATPDEQPTFLIDLPGTLPATTGQESGGEPFSFPIDLPATLPATTGQESGGEPFSFPIDLPATPANLSEETEIEQLPFPNELSVVPAGVADARSADEEETEKYPAIKLAQPPEQVASQEISAEETTHLSRSEILAAQQARRAKNTP